MGSDDSGPLIFSIQHFCLHDGPGVRSIVFFKGCPLRCAWCQNPESWEVAAELAFKEHLCIACGTCVNVCPQQAMMYPGNRDPAKCVTCFTCAEHCPSGALQRFGLPLSLEAVIEDLRHDFSLFKISGGGVTFSGGEPALYPTFTTELTRRLHKEGIHTAMETSGAFHWDKVRPLLEEIDLVLFDIKVFDDHAHRQLCGGSNAVIKENLQKLKDMNRYNNYPSVWPRMPLVPSMTDGVENLHAWAKFLYQNEIYQMTMVPYHRLGDVKRLWLGVKPAPEILTPSSEDLEAAMKIFSEEGVAAWIPGEEEIPPQPPIKGSLQKQ